MAVTVLTAACVTPVGVKVVDGRAAHRELTASALSAEEPSAFTTRVLLREGLLGTFEDNAPRAVATLHQRYVHLYETGSPLQENALFALAETSFLHAEASGDRAYFLASALYAYAFLFPDEGSPHWSYPGAYGPFDPRMRIAADLYNRALAEGLSSGSVDAEVTPGAQRKPREASLVPGKHALPAGEFDLEIDPAGFTWAGYTLEHFVPSANLEIRGLRNRYRQPGLGVPLAASLRDSQDERRTAADARVPPRLKIPSSALVRVPDARRSLAQGKIRGVLSLYTNDVTRYVTIAGRDVPIEYEPTAALAFTLEGSPIWDFELAGFMSGRSRLARGAARAAIAPGPQAERTDDGLFLLAPYRPGKIPVVLVHGTASSPARWAELVNELEIDPRIANRYQFWLFMYNTGNPVAYSGALLRESLMRAVDQLDPEGKDSSLRRMVVIGHSQGGLLTKLTVVDSGNRFWDNVSTVSLDQLTLKPETRRLLESSLFVTPVPYVQRVIFLATPQRGTPLAAGRVVAWLARFIELPLDVSSAAVDLVTVNKDRLALRSLDQLPRSVDNMSPSNPFVRALASLPIADDVKAHSIIAVKGTGSPIHGTDGVVPYWSAHIDGVESELVVRSNHSVQSNPHAIEEVRRILLEHAGNRSVGPD